MAACPGSTASICAVSDIGYPIGPCPAAAALLAAVDPIGGHATTETCRAGGSPRPPRFRPTGLLRDVTGR